jgi:fatty-acyl-CoA synthase
MGIAVTQKALVANATAIARDGLKAGPGDRCVSWLPFYHDMGLVGFLLAPIVAGITVDYFTTRDFARRPLLWLDLISRNRGTISYSPSFGYELSVQRAEKMTLPEGIDLSSWRTAGIGGDMIRPEVLRRFGARFAEHGFNANAFVPSYGMAEATLALSFAPLGSGMKTATVDAGRMEHEGIIVDAQDGNRSREFMLCGVPLPGHEIEVRTPEGTPQPARRVGRIYARGPSLMKAYFNEPEATEAVLSKDGWLDTGDLGYFEGEQIVITGRAKDLVIVNGRNIWPQDLEWTAESHIEGLRSGDVAVFSVDAEASESIVALVQCRTADPEKRQALCDEVSTVLRVECGAVVEVVPVGAHDLPVTSSGKLSRTKARALYHQLMHDAAASA